MMRKRISTPAKGQRRGIGRLFFWILGLLENATLVALTLLLVWAFESRNMPALNIWHTTRLAGEFTSGDATPQRTLKDYLEQEDRLFEELRRKIYDQVPRTAAFAFSRYRADSPQDPSHLPHNWNRSFELVPETIRGGALLLHGLTDSPYSLRRIAARHVRQRVGPETPFLIAGYSNGGALAVKYSLGALSDTDLPPADRLLLFSPEIGITPFSAIANAHKLFSFIPYFEQSKWLSIQPEYDPFKYNSFPKNAGQQGHEITTALQDQLQSARSAGKLAAFPPVVTFLSWVDSTVETSMTIDRFYDRLENPGNELVIFDVNRSDQATVFYPAGDAATLDALDSRSDLPYRLTIIANATSDSLDVTRRTKAPQSASVDIAALGMAWPPGIYSLSHVAIPFAPDDPVYGVTKDPGSWYAGVPIGRMLPRGETQYLTVPLSQFMRLRHNPFFSYVEKRVVAEIDELSGGSLGSKP